MGDSLVPKLVKRTVPIGKLILDPNNPRLITRDEDCHEEKNFLDGDLQKATADRIDAEKIDQIVDSIQQNGWLTVDHIFVKKHLNSQYYVVLEGNRRVAAIRKIRQKEGVDEKLLKLLEYIEVMEIVDDLPDDQLRKKISYLLGVRHHGSLIRWTAFAQAHNIYKRYFELTSQDWDSFRWDSDVGQMIADALSIPVDRVEDRLQVYRAMKQVGDAPRVRDSPGEVKGRYYSLFEEVFLGRKKKKLNSYISQDPDTFIVDDMGVERLINLCHFDIAKRDGAPIQNPQEWRKLEQILNEEDEGERKRMLREVEEDKRPPSHVWAERAVELKKLQWDRWLLKVNSILKLVTLGDDLTSQEARTTVKRLVSLIYELDKRDLDRTSNA